MINRYTVDRFEDNGWAVLESEDGYTFNVPAHWLPENAKEGDVLSLQLDQDADGSNLAFGIDPEATRQRVQEAQRVLDRLRDRSKDLGGDIELS